MPLFHVFLVGGFTTDRLGPSERMVFLPDAMDDTPAAADDDDLHLAVMNDGWGVEATALPRLVERGEESTRPVIRPCQVAFLKV